MSAADAQQQFFQTTSDGLPAGLAIAFAAEKAAKHGQPSEELGDLTTEHNLEKKTIHRRSSIKEVPI